MAAESASAAVILASSHLGFALSTTHVATGSILGTGVGQARRRRCAGRSPAGWSLAWLHHAACGRRSSARSMWWVGDALGGVAGRSSSSSSCRAGRLHVRLRSRRQPVTAGNVNDEWDERVATESREAGACLMNNLALAADGAWKVLLASLVLGAGLPVIFALGVRSRADAAGGGRPAGRTGARTRSARSLFAALLPRGPARRRPRASPSSWPPASARPCPSSTSTRPSSASEDGSVALNARLRGVMDWLLEGYPAGVPPKDYIPLVALLRRRLSDDEIREIGDEIVGPGLRRADHQRHRGLHHPAHRRSAQPGGNRPSRGAPQPLPRLAAEAC